MTPYGFQQVEAAAEKLKSKGIATILSSPYARAFIAKWSANDAKA
ncbi:MAG: histidine phosphatase family protein [Alphaproteobacteria bacterium]|nr:histidine phosphatase family protein [Alphaproteobacteria bacterium]